MDDERQSRGLNGHGKIDVITGPMFSGKTKELIRRIERAEIAGLQFQRFTPSEDTLGGTSNWKCHSDQVYPATPVASGTELEDLVLPETKVVGIDEGQFLDDSIVEVAVRLADCGVHVIIAGLDQDFKRRPFGPMPLLMAVADRVIKLRAVCKNCSRSSGEEIPAMHSRRLVASEEVVVIGEENEYEASCRRCHPESNGNK